MTALEERLNALKKGDMVLVSTHSINSTSRATFMGYFVKNVKDPAFNMETVTMVIARLKYETSNGIFYEDEHRYSFSNIESIEYIETKK